jgi:hypothetical protein
MAKAKTSTEEVEQKEPTLPGVSKEYECWNVTVTVTTPINLETGEKERKVTFEKKGTEPARITVIDDRHADILNQQVENTKQYYYPKN